MGWFNRQDEQILDMLVKLSNSFQNFVRNYTMDQATELAELNAINATLKSNNAAITAELATMNASITTLTAKVANAGNTTPEVDAALADVQASADALTALVPPTPAA